MIKMLILALWASAIAALSSYRGGAMARRPMPSPRPRTGRRSRLRISQDRASSMCRWSPTARCSAMSSSQLLYAIDAKAAEKLNVNPEAFVLDFAFRKLYGDPSLDFRHLDKYDVNGLTRQIADHDEPETRRGHGQGSSGPGLRLHAEGAGAALTRSAPA